MGIILRILLKGRQDFILYFLCILGLFFSFLLGIFWQDFHKLKNIKYDRCKKIEKVLGTEQHRSTEKDLSGFQKFGYIFITALFMAAWLMLAMSILERLL